MKYYIYKMSGSSLALTYTKAGADCLCNIKKEDGESLPSYDIDDIIIIYLTKPTDSCPIVLESEGSNSFRKILEVFPGAMLKDMPNDLQETIISDEKSTWEISEDQYKKVISLMISSVGLLPKVRQEQINRNSIQKIYYGAPGTGKSHAINTLTSTKSVIRTTFHPDSDYSTFVGAYKPTTEEQTRYNDSGVPVTYHDGDHKGEPIKDKVIVYDFVEQAFLKAYEEAWKKFFANPDAPEDEYLVIEEINRGNCAQIFGDLFQLLDRNQYGYSEYPITADNDISKHLKDVFTKEQLHLDDHDIINHMYNRGDGDVAQKVLNGDILLLPKNLYIWATMNTSDQSLFPIDSAFKRRWDWKYQPITKGLDAAGHDLNWRLEIDADHQYDWWSVISNINSKIIGKLTKSEDKKLGYFFCKASNGVIDKDIFVERVLFYLWNEILKDFEPSQDFLKDETLKGENDGYLCYDLFYDTTNGKAKIIGDRVDHLLANLKVVPWEEKAEKNDHTDQTVEETGSTQENISE